jgi:glycosyltransferase involved in cell wall biosynthesis
LAWSIYHRGMAVNDSGIPKKIWLVHDWLTGMRGGEKVLLRLSRLFPDASIATLFVDRTAIDPELARRVKAVSVLQHVPGMTRHYRKLLPILPAAVRTIRIPRCDLVISISHCVAKGVRVPAGARHLCYCLAPMRYIWEPAELYFGAQRGAARAALDAFTPLLRRIDRRQNEDVDSFATTCRNVAERIDRHYRRAARIIYPGIDLLSSTDMDGGNSIAAESHDDFFLIVGALVPYKRVDLAVAAFAQRPERKLIIIGKGPAEQALRAMASGAGNITFLGWQPDAIVRAHYARCRALLFPGEEDFGLVPLEVQAAGRPVIAFGRGGVLETVRPFPASATPTGVLFSEQSPDAVNAAIDLFEQHANAFSSAAARQKAERFQWEAFDRGILEWVHEQTNH